MVTIKHIITKQLTKDAMRVVFEIEARPNIKYEGELILELRWFFGTVWTGLVGEYRLSSEVKQRFKWTFPHQKPNVSVPFAGFLQMELCSMASNLIIKAREKRIRIIRI